MELKIWSEFGCFTRPEHKADRVTYEFITPSAARGCLEAIFWKPEMRWVIDQIVVLNPIRRMSVMTNEIKSKQSYQIAVNSFNGNRPYYVSDDRTQRHSLILKEPAYIIRAHVELKPHADKPVVAYEEQFRKRVERGRCFHQPYMGVRDFMAFFEKPAGDEQPIDLTDDFGLMLHDIEFEPDSDGPIAFWKQTSRQGASLVKGRAKPRFFNAQMIKGVIQCS
jgi:CRISPR-associated protein Cas5d